jgi:5-methylcytosine-specific restriction endonuclease McrA
MHNQALRTKTKAEFKANRKLALERDHYRCQECGIFAFDAEMHHLVPFNKSHDNSVSNLITLCHKCHLKVHNR